MPLHSNAIVFISGVCKRDGYCKEHIKIVKCYYEAKGGIVTVKYPGGVQAII